jgi:hypothetical protein
MLNLQQTKTLSALINDSGITDNFDHHIDGYIYICLFELIDQISELTDLQIDEFEFLTEGRDGKLKEVTSFRLSSEDKDAAKAILNKQVDSFIKDGLPTNYFE